MLALARKNPDNIALQSFDKAYFDKLSPDLQERLLKCMNSGIENPDSSMGCYACQPADYDDLRPFFSKALATYHKVSPGAKHKNSWDLAGLKDSKGLPPGNKLDLAALGLPPLSMRVRVGRNLADFPLPGAMTQQDRCDLENKMCTAFDALISDPAYGGKYCSFTPGHPNFVDEAEYQALVDAHIAFKDMS
eukprot:SAG22_NODE_4919_length_1132_cov_1.320426_1_plen_190_part_10